MHLTRREALVLAATLPAATQVQAQTQMRLGAIAKYAPSWVASQLMVRICQRAAVPLQILPMPAARVSKLSLAGELDGDLVRVRAYGDQNPSMLRVEPPYYQLDASAFSLKSRRLRLRGKADLRPLSLTAIRGFAYINELLGDHPAITPALDSEQMFRMLNAGRVDAALLSSVAARPSLAKLGMLDQVDVAEMAVYELYLYLHPSRQALAAPIGEAIRRMRAEGELARLKTIYEAALAAVDIERFTDSGFVQPQAR